MAGFRFFFGVWVSHIGCIFKERGKLCRICRLLIRALHHCSSLLGLSLTAVLFQPNNGRPRQESVHHCWVKSPSFILAAPSLLLRHFIQIRICTLSPVSLRQLLVVPPPLPHVHWIRSRCALVSHTPSSALTSRAFSVLFHPLQLKLLLMIVIKQAFLNNEVGWHLYLFAQPTFSS